MSDAAERIKARKAVSDAAHEKAHRLSHEFYEEMFTSGLNVSELARVLGVTRSTIYSWKKLYLAKRKKT